MPTTEKLALALEQWKAPQAIIDAARAGRYDNYKSSSATPITDLIVELQQFGLHGLAARAINGEFDATKEEADAWFEYEGRRMATS